RRDGTAGRAGGAGVPRAARWPAPAGRRGPPRRPVARRCRRRVARPRHRDGLQRELLLRAGAARRLALLLPAPSARRRARDGGVRTLHLAMLVLVALPLVGWQITREGYQVRRLMAFLNPARDPHGVGFQLTQSFIAFGSGGLWGVGLGESRQKMFYLPEAHTD